MSKDVKDMIIKAALVVVWSIAIALLIAFLVSCATYRNWKSYKNPNGPHPQHQWKGDHKYEAEKDSVDYVPPTLPL